MLGKCYSCGKLRFLIWQTNFGIRRAMCKGCCEAANYCETRMTSLTREYRIQDRNAFRALREEKAEEDATIPSNWLELYCKGELSE